MRAAEVTRKSEVDAATAKAVDAQAEAERSARERLEQLAAAEKEIDRLRNDAEELEAQKAAAEKAAAAATEQARGECARVNCRDVLM